MDTLVLEEFLDDLTMSKLCFCFQNNNPAYNNGYLWREFTSNDVDAEYNDSLDVLAYVLNIFRNKNNMPKFNETIDGEQYIVYLIGWNKKIYKLYVHYNKKDNTSKYRIVVMQNETAELIPKVNIDDLNKFVYSYLGINPKIKEIDKERNKGLKNVLVRKRVRKLAKNNVN